MKPLRLIVSLAVLAFALSACSGDGATSTSATDPSPGSTTASSSTTTAPPAGSEVVIQNIAFNPAEITVQAGTTVTWENDDGPSHTSTSADDLWDSDAIAPGDDFSFTFDEPGTYEYFCRFHGSMKGTVIVEG